MFTIRQWVAILLLMLLTACAGSDFSTPNASGRYTNSLEQCVPYARKVSGIQIRGDAHTWWNKAAPNYPRGQKPKKGAVLVLAKTQKLPHGHLAVVTEIIDARTIEVTHSNWGYNKKTRSIIYDSMRVQDISPRNDWTRLKFWNPEARQFGLPYAAKGFIYKN